MSHDNQIHEIWFNQLLPKAMSALDFKPLSWAFCEEILLDILRILFNPKIVDLSCQYHLVRRTSSKYYAHSFGNKPSIGVQISTYFVTKFLTSIILEQLRLYEKKIEWQDMRQKWIYLAQFSLFEKFLWWSGSEFLTNFTFRLINSKFIESIYGNVKYF